MDSYLDPLELPTLILGVDHSAILREDAFRAGKDIVATGLETVWHGSDVRKQHSGHEYWPGDGRFKGQVIFTMAFQGYGLDKKISKGKF